MVECYVDIPVMNVVIFNVNKSTRTKCYFVVEFVLNTQTIWFLIEMNVTSGICLEEKKEENEEF